MLAAPFLTDLDSRAQVKGSRDPLGIQQIWTRLGRHVVGNLTTVSSSVRDFTTLVLGYYFADRIADEVGVGSELATFLKWEQLAAYARGHVNGDWQFRGTERARKTLSEGARVTLSHARAYQILSDQKTYGLWGLYTMPARASALLERDPTRPTAPVLELIEKGYLPILERGAGRDARAIRDVLAADKVRLDLAGRHTSLIAAVARVLARKLMEEERELYYAHLVLGGPLDPTDGRQAQLAELLVDTLPPQESPWSPSPAALAHLAKVARARGSDWHALAHRLERILTCERVLAPASALFDYVLGLDGVAVDTLVTRLRESWGMGLRTVDAAAFAELEGEIAGEDREQGERWVAIASALAGGDYLSLIYLLVEQNARVMAGRGGAAWLEARDGRLHVRFRDEQGTLPRLEAIPTLWRFPYFLESLRSVAVTLKAA